MKSVILDIEADALDPNEVKNIWCIVCKDIETLEVSKFYGSSLAEKFLDYAKNVNTWIGHNVVEYDYPVLDRFFSNSISKSSIIDTLVLSRLLKFKPSDGEGQSLEAWGERLGYPKHPSPDFSKFSNEMLEYCVQDVEITYKLYEYLFEHLSDPCWASSIQCEMSMAWICQDMHLNGFRYDKTKADTLKASLQTRLSELDSEIIACFPPKLKPVREILPKLTKHGTISKANLPRDWTDLTRVHADCPFTLVERVVFNPASTSQIVDRLNDAGWQPFIKTATGKGYKVNEDNLATLPEDAPEGARKLVERILVAARVRTLTEWEEAYNENTGRVHGKFAHIGTWPGRMAHRSPNLGNIATKKSIKYKGAYLKQLATDLGEQMRNFWICDDDSWLIGCDMDAAHVRLFAHYIDDPEFTKAVCAGDKKLGTDVHTLGAKTFEHLGCDRDKHKTFIFSFFNGAGPPKIAEIFGCSLGEARKALELYARRFPGIRELREKLIPSYARQGWFPGLDGRKVYYGEEHGMFAGMLQSGEAVVMKHANILWKRELNGNGIEFKQVNLVHDEYVIEVRGHERLAETVGQIQSRSIAEVGRFLGLQCPLAGEYKVGKTWLEVH